jgi:signal transduction histidine kinase
VELTLDAASGLPSVEADAARIAQVTGNLIENAVFQTPEGGSVRLSAEVEEGRVRVAVEDTGPGIEPEELERIFDRFYRVDPSRTRATGGAGLGLTIAKQLVEAHGGVIYAQSTPGVGSRFVFELPAVTA